MAQRSSIEILEQPLTLPCGLTLPNRLVKCPMQETLASYVYKSRECSLLQLTRELQGTAV